MTPGPAPARGAADGSDFHLGEPRTFIDIYPTYAEVSLADVNGDGRPDLLASSRDDLHLYVALGPARLAPLLPLATGVSVYAYRRGSHFALADDDEHVDVVVGHMEGISLLFNDGFGDFSRFLRTLGPPSQRPVVVDVDLDGDRDVVALSAEFSAIEGSVVFYLNDGGGSFEVEQLELDAPGSRLRVADVTGDELPELLISRGGGPRVAVHARSSSDGEFEVVNELVGGGSGITYNLWFETGDLDGDGLLDVVMLEDEDAPDIEHVRVSYQRNGVLEPPRIVATIPKDSGNIAGGEVRVFDINLDSRADIVFTSTAFNMVVLLGQPDGSFREVHTTYPTAASILEEAIAIGDVNCDGCPDVLGAQVGAIVLFPGVACAY